jgi:hypothetical protein
MMGIVHAALRRDLQRVREAVTTEPFPQGGQRRALGEHVVWLMDFLHAHHESEDRGLWPLVRIRNPAAGALLDSLEADHERIDPLAVALREAGSRYGERAEDDARSTLAKAVDALALVLYSHLDREVGEAMPVVSASITRAEWHEVEQTYTIKPKSLPQLAMEAQWVIDGIDAENYAVVHDTVPRLMRWVVLRGFAGRYRRAARLRWDAGAEARLMETS